ncbi:MAG: nuclear transport factor 2 family protein [Anaerolineae bacterium]|nr:nuclear transport factor 2 family protein [Anaerolineae bacterium]
MRQLILMLLLVLALAGCAGSATPTVGNSGAEGVVRQWIDAYNKADLATVTNLLTPDATLIPLNATKTYQGTDTLRDLFNADFPYGVQIRLDKAQVNGDSVVGDVMLWSTKKGAFPDTPVQYTWTVKGNKISAIVIKHRQAN